jgi:hypothetical protein
MFTRAGFSRRRRSICRAWIGHRAGGWIRPSTLVRFVESGEFAWEGRGGISWPEHVIVFTLREVLGSLAESRASFPSSKLPECAKEEQ